MLRNSSTRARWAALTSGALVAGGLVVAPAVAGLGAASAAPTTLGYTCTMSFGGTDYPFDSTLDIEVTTPESVEAGEELAAVVDLSLDMGSIPSMGPITSLSGALDVALAVGGAETVVSVPVSDGTPAALLFEGTDEVTLTAPEEGGDAPISVGDVTGSFTGNPLNVPTSIPCVPDEGQDQTVGTVPVTSAGPASFGYTCTMAFGAATYPFDSTLAIDVATPESVAAGEELAAVVDLSLDMGSIPSMGPVTSLSGTVDFPLSVGGVETVVSVPVSDGTPAALLFEGAEEVALTAPDASGEAPISVGDLTGSFTANPVGMPTSIPCVADEGQDLTVGSVEVEKAAPVAVPVAGKVKIKGTPKVGKKLKAVPGATDGAEVSYRWLANGKAIKKARTKTLKLRKSLKGKKVSVRAIYAQDGFLETVQTSKAVKVRKR